MGIGPPIAAKALVAPRRVHRFDEFFGQGDAEKRLGLPVSALCDRDAVDMPSCQVGFYSFLVQPLYEAMHLLVPMDQQLENLREMQQHWQQQKEQQEGSKGAEA